MPAQEVRHAPRRARRLGLLRAPRRIRRIGGRILELLPGRRPHRRGAHRSVRQQARARRLDGPASALLRVRRLCPGRGSGPEHRRPPEPATHRRLRVAAHRDAARLGEPLRRTGPAARPQHAPAPAGRPAAPVSRYLGHYAGTPPQQEALRVDDRVRDREPAGMDTALLAYSGISVKMMVDRALGAELLVMFMVDYEPGGAAQAHDHPFEEAYFFLEGEIDAEVDGLAYQLRAGDVLFAGVGSTHGFYNTGRGRVRWIETQAPQPPGRHSYRWTGPWQRLESQTSGNTGRPWLHT